MKTVYVFVGQNATCGTPHPQTGRLSYFGTIYRINGTRKQALEFANYIDRYGDKLTAIGGRRKMRDYCLGMSMRNFDDCLNNAPVVHADTDENACDWIIGD